MNLQSSKLKSKVEVQSHQSDGHDFFECKLPLNKIVSIEELPCCDIELKKPNGTTLLIKMANQALLSSLIRSFIEWIMLQLIPHHRLLLAVDPVDFRR